MNNKTRVKTESLKLYDIKALVILREYKHGAISEHEALQKLSELYFVLNAFD